MPTSRRSPDAEGDKRRALKHAAATARNATKAESAQANAIKLAAEAGASLREISDATNISHMTVKRIIERTSTNV